MRTLTVGRQFEVSEKAWELVSDVGGYARPFRKKVHQILILQKLSPVKVRG